MDRKNFLFSFASLSLLPLINKEKDSVFGKLDDSIPEKYIKVKKDIFGEELNDSFCDGTIYLKYKNSYYFNKETRIDVKDFGAKGDGINDDGVVLQKAIDLCVKYKKSLYISRPLQSYLSRKELKINGQIYIYGDGINLSGINFVDCNGLIIDEDPKNIIIEKITLNQAVRYTTKVNNFIGINIIGYDKNRAYTNIFRDILIDGFQTSIKCSWIWDSLFENIKILFSNIGIEITGTSVNNNIVNSSISIENVDSKGIYFSDRFFPSEGWKISNNLIFGAEIAIQALYTNNVYLIANILDFCQKHAIVLESTEGPSTNWQILGGYIAMSGKEGYSAIKINNNIDNDQIRGIKISNVDILVYPGGKCDYGVLVTGIYDVLNVTENTFTNFKNFDVKITNSNQNRVINNYLRTGYLNQNKVNFDNNTKLN
jgi:hypothetical protein